MHELNPELINQLMGVPSPELMYEVDIKITDCIIQLEQKLNKPLIRPTVFYDLKGRTAGWAIGNIKIRLNLDILNDPRYHEDMINRTLPHEVAHCVEHQLYGTGGHGGRWAYLMSLLGLAAERCHQYETTSARKRNTKKFYYNCGCEDGHAVSAIIDRRIKQGRNYRCNKCGQTLR